jgi:plasmid maintenance system antidote protein VapI
VKEVWHQWRGYIADITPKSVVAVMSETPSAPQELFRFRRNKFKKEDRDFLQVGTYLVMRVGRNGNGRPMCTVSVAKKPWTEEDQRRAEQTAKEYVEVFGIGEVHEDDDFVPNWASPPGSTLGDVLKAKNLTESEAASLTSIPLYEFLGILRGTTEITPEHAQALEVLGAPASFWMERERQYRKDLARLTKT